MLGPTTFTCRWTMQGSVPNSLSLTITSRSGIHQQGSDPCVRGRKSKVRCMRNGDGATPDIGLGLTPGVDSDRLSLLQSCNKTYVSQLCAFYVVF